MLTRRTPQEVQLEIKDPVDPDALLQSRAILDELRSGTSTSGNRCSSNALLAIAKRFGDIPDDASSGYVVSPERCSEAFESLSSDERRSLLNIHARVKLFAEAQRNSVVDMEIDIPGGKAGQTVSPCRGESSFSFRLAMEGAGGGSLHLSFRQFTLSPGAKKFITLPLPASVKKMPINTTHTTRRLSAPKKIPQSPDATHPADGIPSPLPC